MAYAVKSDLEAYLTLGFLSEIDDQTIDLHLADASETADSYLGQRYNVPLAAYGRALTSCVCKIARWQIALRVGLGSETERGVYENDAKESVLWLRDVASGKASIPGAPIIGGETIVPDEGPFAVITKKPRGWYA